LERSVIERFVRETLETNEKKSFSNLNNLILIKEGQGHYDEAAEGYGKAIKMLEEMEPTSELLRELKMAYAMRSNCFSLAGKPRRKPFLID